MFVLVAVFAGLAPAFAGTGTTTVVIDKTQFSFESDCQKAAEALEAKFKGKVVQVGATCIYVR